MSIFNDHIADTDNIVLRYYDVSDGTLIPSHPSSDEPIPTGLAAGGIYVTAEWAWDKWRLGRIEMMEIMYKVRVKSLNKKSFIKYIEEKGSSVHKWVYQGVIYYNWKELGPIFQQYEILRVLRHCKKYNFHWEA